MRIRVHYGDEESTVVQSDDRDFIGAFLSINEEIKRQGWDEYLKSLPVITEEGGENEQCWK